jgi:hypothetical protein
MRQTMRTMGSFHWHVLAGQTAFPVQVAVRTKIPLVVWGVHQGCDQVGMYSHLDEVEMTRKYRCEHDLMGYEAEDLVGLEERLTETELRPYFYPNSREIERVGVRGIYLSNYIRWDTKAQHEAMLQRYDYETAAQQRTFDTYSDVDCIHYSGAHDHIKYAKWGYGKATDHACREIRLRRMTRREGLELVRRYAGVPPRDLPRLVEFLDMSAAEFDRCVDRFRDPRIRQRQPDGAWTHRDDKVHQTSDDAALGKIEDCHFIETGAKTAEPAQDGYTLLHRGWVDRPRGARAAANRMERNLS